MIRAISAFLLSILFLAGCPAAQILPTPQNGERHVMEGPVQNWEDGRRTVANRKNFEWWYLDGILEDGTVVVVWFGDNWFPGSYKRAINIEITTPDGKKRKILKLLDTPGEFSTEKADVKIGPHSFKGDLDTYRVVVDPDAQDGLGCDLTLVRTAPPFRNFAGYFAIQTGYFAWLAAVPDGNLSGTITFDGETKEVLGSGYHDHNWGDMPPWKLLRNWWWGRGKVGDRVVVMADLRPTKQNGGGNYPLLYIGRTGEMRFYRPDELKFSELEETPHPDKKNKDAIAKGVRIEANDGTVVIFRRKAIPPLDSTDILAFKGGAIEFFGKLFGFSPWYTRFEAEAELRDAEGKSVGTGTLEFMDFE